jgi:hypothetical protein
MPDSRHGDYREQALKLLPWICTRCAREFPASRLRELTVHHRDGDHHHNPPDGSNWELLCLYCHENEHARVEDAKAGDSARDPARPVATHRPLAALDKLLKDKPREKK